MLRPFAAFCTGRRCRAQRGRGPTLRHKASGALDANKSGGGRNVARCAGPPAGARLEAQPCLERSSPFSRQPHVDLPLAPPRRRAAAGVCGWGGPWGGTAFVLVLPNLIGPSAQRPNFGSAPSVALSALGGPTSLLSRRWGSARGKRAFLQLFYSMRLHRCNTAWRSLLQLCCTSAARPSLTNGPLQECGGTLGISAAMRRPHVVVR